MSSRSSLWWKTFLQHLHRRSQPPPNANLMITSHYATVAKLGDGYPMRPGLQLIGSRASYGTWRSKLRTPPAPGPGTSGAPPPRFNFPGWARWLVGSVLTLFFPFWKEKWAKLQRIEGEAEMVMEEVEHVAEVVEKVAKKAETITAEVAEKLPDDSKLKEAVLMAERFSTATAHEAHLTTEIIHMVEALKQDAGDLETLVEPIVEKIVEKAKERKEAGK